MGRKILVSIGILGALVVLLRLAANPSTADPLTTAWNEPDLQGIWTDEYQTPLQRPARFAGREFLSDRYSSVLYDVSS
jgi:hypothetical protein